MNATSIGRMAVPSLALVAACGAALAFGIAHVWREPPVESRAAIAEPAVSPPEPADRNGSAPALASARTEANAVTPDLAAPPRLPEFDGAVPTFDVARIERTGDAVIAGTAAPGATVQLLRNGEIHDRAVADQAGQFVMIPPRLPPGNYELTLRSRQPDGKQVTSKQGVTVALADIGPNSVAVGSRADLPFDVPETTGASRSEPDQAAGSSQALRPSGPSAQLAKRQDFAVLPQPHVTAALPLSNGGSPSAGPGPRIATTVVSPGDSLWRISRLAYGAGTRYAIVYRANRDHIQNPNRIYPGQIFILPAKAR